MVPKLTDPNGDSNGTKSNGRPSDGRRHRLVEELSIPTVSNFFPIERYYDAAQKAYEMVLDTYEAKMLDDAYLYGKRYCIFCLDAIPKHNYYNSNAKYKSYVIKHTKQVAIVLDLLEKVALAMDQEELEQEKIRQQRLIQEQLERDRMAQRKFDEIQSRIQQQKKKGSTESTTAGDDVAQSALSKLALLSQQSYNSNNAERIRQDPSGVKGETSTTATTTSSSNTQTSTRYKLVIEDGSSDDDDDNNQQPILPPPLLPPPLLPPPPEYNAIVASSRPDDNNISNGPPHYQSTIASSFPRKKKVQSQRVSIRALQEQYKMQYVEYQKVGKIQVFGLDTYQGRVYDSTNGCTVISALIAASHLRNEITNATICTIMDCQAGPILREIRSKLGLSGQALIIPSDVHDHFVDQKLFSQEQFVGAAGGNILDRNHYGEFLKLLAVGLDGKCVSNRSSATLFFREHVISIVKVPLSGGASYYDLIDSLPGAVNGKATRTRCIDILTLEIVLQWYATRKFNTSDHDRQYIDKNKWDDAMADIDPRVFQGFVWMNVKQ